MRWAGEANSSCGRAVIACSVLCTVTPAPFVDEYQREWTHTADARKFGPMEIRTLGSYLSLVCEVIVGHCCRRTMCMRALLCFVSFYTCSIQAVQHVLYTV